MIKSSSKPWFIWGTNFPIQSYLQLQVSLRFRAEERCHFLREETREVEDESALDPLLRDFGPMDVMLSHISCLKKLSRKILRWVVGLEENNPIASMWRLYTCLLIYHKNHSHELVGKYTYRSSHGRFGKAAYPGTFLLPPKFKMFHDEAIGASIKKKAFWGC